MLHGPIDIFLTCYKYNKIGAKDWIQAMQYIGSYNSVKKIS